MDLGPSGWCRTAGRRLAVGVLALQLAVGCTAATPPAPPEAAAPPPRAAGVPRYLEGQPLTGPTGLRLLMASDPPRLVDVDRNTSLPVSGVAGQAPFSVAELGAGAIIIGDRQVFVLGRGSARARPLGRGGTAVTSLDGRGVWLLEQGRRCRLREVGLDGRARRPPRKVPCTTGLSAETSLGVLIWTEDGGEAALLDPGSGRIVARYPEVLGVAGDLVLWSERDDGPLTLTNRRTGASQPVPRPTPHGQAGLGQASPDGRLLAIEFGDTSWSRVQGQVSDIWLLDLQARSWRRLPGMPLITGLKFMSMAWTGDGRLVLAGDFERFGEAMATWRPGQEQLAVKRLTLPDYAGSDSFVPLPAST
jgi:hypothetical protein